MSLLYHNKKINLRKIRIGKEVRLQKRFTVLGREFEKTMLGNDEGSIVQYRGPYASHIREYPGYYTAHRDRVDPRRNPIDHLIRDAPDDLAGLIIGGGSALIVGKLVYDRVKESSSTPFLDALAAAGVAGLIGYLFGKWLAK